MCCWDESAQQLWQRLPDSMKWMDYSVQAQIQFPAGAFGGGIGRLVERDERRALRGVGLSDRFRGGSLLLSW